LRCGSFSEHVLARQSKASSDFVLEESKQSGILATSRVAYVFCTFDHRQAAAARTERFRVVPQN